MVTLKPNMYVRFKDNKDIQYIGKLININEHREPCFKYAIEVTWYDDYIFIGDDDIIDEPSFDLIGLIKVGDYVNGLLVILNTIERGGNIVVVIGGNCFRVEEIKSVVTREQFESMKYIVERNDK